MLRVEGLTKRFAGLLAVDDVTLEVPQGAITGLIGPNGAGKTTLFAMIAGFLPPSAGRVVFESQDVTGMKPHLRAKAGMARTFQIVQPFASLTVRDNIAVGAYLRTSSRSEALARAAEVARRVGLEAELDKTAAGLTVAGRKRLELARALATAPKLLLLDEVLAGLNPSEIRDILPVLSAIRDRDGITILMIEHIMQAVMTLCETVHVLAGGRVIAKGTPQTVCSEPRVIEAYLGAGAAERLHRQEAASHA